MVLRKSGICVGSKRILRLMREMEIHSLMNRRFKKPGTHVDHSQRPNLIKHQPNARIWRADITYLVFGITSRNLGLSQFYLRTKGSSSSCFQDWSSDGGD